MLRGHRSSALLARRLCTAASNAAAIAAQGRGYGLKFYQFSYVDLFGVQRSKLVPASRVEEIATGGAGFAGFASHLDMDPTMGDLLAIPDPATLTRVGPWARGPPIASLKHACVGPCNRNRGPHSEGGYWLVPRWGTQIFMWRIVATYLLT